jgi:hypothetical protein
METLPFPPGAALEGDIRVNLRRGYKLLGSIAAPPIIRSALIEGELDWWRMVGRKFVVDDPLKSPLAVARIVRAPPRGVIP